MNIFTFYALRGQIQNNPHASQHFGVNAIGFGQSADSLCKSSRLFRIDLDEGVPRQTEISLKPTMIGTGRLENEQYPIILAQPGA